MTQPGKSGFEPRVRAPLCRRTPYRWATGDSGTVGRGRGGGSEPHVADSASGPLYAGPLGTAEGGEGEGDPNPVSPDLQADSLPLSHRRQREEEEGRRGRGRGSEGWNPVSPALQADPLLVGHRGQRGGAEGDRRRERGGGFEPHVHILQEDGFLLSDRGGQDCAEGGRERGGGFEPRVPRSTCGPVTSGSPSRPCPPGLSLP